MHGTSRYGPCIAHVLWSHAKSMQVVCALNDSVGLSFAPRCNVTALCKVQLVGWQKEAGMP